MWINDNGKLRHVVDEMRHQYKTNIKRDIIDHLKQLSSEYDTNVSYLIENGFENMLEQNLLSHIVENKDKSNRKQILLTMDVMLYQQLEQIAKDLGVKKNTVVETASLFVDPAKAKKDMHRYRIEKRVKEEKKR